MTDEEIITAKSAEIKRLHNVCRVKDLAIQNAIKAFEQLKENFHCNTWEFVDNTIRDLESNLG